MSIINTSGLTAEQEKQFLTELVDAFDENKLHIFDVSEFAEMVHHSLRCEQISKNKYAIKIWGKKTIRKGSLEECAAFLDGILWHSNRAEELEEWYGLHEPTHFGTNGTNCHYNDVFEYKKMTDNLPGFDAWLLEQADAHMQSRMRDDEYNEESEQDMITEHEIQRILDIQAEADHG
jgi:hypothetical protein